MRGLAIVGVLCLTSMPALACVFDTDCKPGSSCRNGACSGIEMNSGDVKPSVPKERVKVRSIARTTAIAAKALVASKARS